jgi:D-lactate dehydrogenase (cytochrome)
VPGGFAEGVAFPKSSSEVATLVASAYRVLPVGAQSSLTGGATPRGDLVVSTRALKHLSAPSGNTVRAGAGVPLADLQRTLAASGLYYPPVPTYDGAFVGGTISTNAAGAATFKYGSTRPWVEGLTVVLADGSIIEVRRGEITASPEGWFEIERPSGEVARVPIPTYTMPNVAKLSAGYFARPGMDLVDLFIGSEGTLGIVTEATLRVIPKPGTCVALVRCSSDDQAVAVTAALRRESGVSAIEYMDQRALAAVPDEAFARAGVARADGASAMLLVQMEIERSEDDTLARFTQLLESCSVDTDPQVVLPSDDRGKARLFELREAVPASVNARVAAAKAQVHPGIEKTAGDLVVPFERLADSLAMYRDVFERHGLDYAIWGHVSDGNLHPNVVPRSFDDVARGREAILEMGRAVMAMGGAPLAEHGVGRSGLKQRLLRELYGQRGIDEMRAVKRALDPEWKLSAGVLFPETDERGG